MILPASGPQPEPGSPGDASGVPPGPAGPRRPYLRNMMAWARRALAGAASGGPAGDPTRSVGEGLSGGYQRRWETRGEGRRGRGRSVADQSRTSYYGIAPIHKPHWKWLVITYFYLGGIAGGSYALASIAELMRVPAYGSIARAGRYISLAALAPTPLLLILDLGRPERFHHMLRVFKLRSPMSVGTWTLTIFGGVCSLSALIQAAQDGVLGRRSSLARLLVTLPSRRVGLLGMVPAFFLAGYTGVLLAATAVPLWTKSYLLMGPLFLASALSNATAAIALALALARGTSHRTLARLERLDSVFLLAEAGLLLAARAHLGAVIARPLRQGHVGGMYRFGVLGLGLGLPLAIQLGSQRYNRNKTRGGGASRLATALASLLVLGGGFLFRYVIVMAGRQSADDPQATFELTKGS